LLGCTLLHERFSCNCHSVGIMRAPKQIIICNISRIEMLCTKLDSQHYWNYSNGLWTHRLQVLYGRDLELSGFTMPLRCEHSLKALQTNYMNSPTFVLTLFSMFFRCLIDWYMMKQGSAWQGHRHTFGVYS